MKNEYKTQSSEMASTPPHPRVPPLLEDIEEEEGKAMTAQPHPSTTCSVQASVGDRWVFNNVLSR